MRPVLLALLLAAACSTPGRSPAALPDGGGADLARSPVTPACVAPGQLCGSQVSCCEPADCVSGSCCVSLTLKCAANGDCCSGECVAHACCASDGDSCQADSDCCGGSCFNANCCKLPGLACKKDSECCSGSCVGGGCSCLPGAYPCQLGRDEQCCSHSCGSGTGCN